MTVDIVAAPVAERMGELTLSPCFGDEFESRQKGT